MQRMRKSMLIEARSSPMVFFTTVLLLSLGSASAGGKDPLFPGPVRPGNLDYRTELQQGYLKVYSVSDEFNDGAYYAHSSYAIYSTHGTLVKTVENSISRTDELIPREVVLPIGSYTVVTRFGESWRSSRSLSYQGSPADDCRSGSSRTGDIQTILADQLSPGEFKPFVTFNLTKTLHEHPSEE